MDIDTLQPTLAFLGNFGFMEIMLIGVIGLLVFGNRLPSVGRSLGKGIVEFKKGLRGMKDEIDEAAEEGERAAAKKELESKQLQETKAVDTRLADVKAPDAKAADVKAGELKSTPASDGSPLIKEPTQGQTVARTSPEMEKPHV